MEGMVWYIVSNWETGSYQNFTSFQPESISVKLAHEEGIDLKFSFYIPGMVPDYSTTCVQVYVGSGKREVMFNTVGYSDLFCMQKGSSSFEVMPKDKAIKLMRQLHQPAIMPKSR